MKHYLEKDETELLALTESALEKISQMSDEEFDALELYPDFERQTHKTIFRGNAYFYYFPV